MSILTGRDLQFLANLRTDWRKRYLSEVTRLLMQDNATGDAPPDAPSADRQYRPWSDSTPNWVAKSLETRKRSGV
jgi:hypothetical protein